MGSGEAATPTKVPKTSSAQEQQQQQQQQQQPAAAAAPPPYPEWPYQGYAGFFPAGAGPQPPHPYMWGAQPMMPPFGTPPPPYGPIYPYMPPGAATEAADGKSSDGKERSPLKRSKAGGPQYKASEGGGKTGAGNGVVSPSGGESSDGSSDASDEDHNGTDKRNSEQAVTAAEGGNAGQAAYPAQNTFPSPGVPAPGGKTPTTVNHVDYWGGAASAGTPTSKGKRNQAIVAGMPTMQPTRDGVPPELWLQDERELKRQRRKQSNRESARRSRLRKQAECEELAQRVDSLGRENESLRAELEQVLEDRNKLAEENASLLEQLQKREDASGGSNENEELQTDENGSMDVNGRLEGENCDSVGKAALEAAASNTDASAKAEAAAAAG